LASKIKALEEKVLNPVHKVQDAVQHTVDAVQGTVQSAHEKITEVRSQVSDHPWIAIGAGVVVGMIAGYVSAPSGSSASNRRGASGNGHSGNGSRLSSGYAGESASASSSKSSGIGSWFSEEWGKFKGIAIGAAVALARDFLKDQAPQFSESIDEFMNDMTNKLGATPFKERLFQNGFGSSFRSSATSRPAAG